MKRNRKLSARQLLFVEEYLKGNNIFQSAIRAGYKENYAKGLGYKLLENNGIKAEIEKRRQKIQKKTDMTLKEVIEILANLARQNVKNFYDENGNFIDIQDLPDEVAASVAGIEIEELHRGAGRKKKKKGSILKKIRFHSKVEALKELRKHFEGDRVSLVDPAMVKLFIDMIAALPKPQQDDVWEVVGDRVKLLKEGKGS